MKRSALKGKERDGRLEELGEANINQALNRQKGG